jgi:hypothetical protein
VFLNANTRPVPASATPVTVPNVVGLTLVGARLNPRSAQAQGDLPWSPVQRMRWTHVLRAPFEILYLACPSGKH